MVTAFFDESSDGSAHRWASRRPARRARRRTAVASLMVGGVLVSGAVLVAMPSATAEVTADRSTGAEPTARVPLVTHSDIDYGLVPNTCPPAPAPDPGYCLDLYKKDGGRSKRPLVLLIHGGGWVADAIRDQQRFVGPAKDLARAGYVSLILDYPAASNEPPIPGTTMQEDAVNEAVAWASKKSNRLQYGIDQTKIAFIGGSSGGQLSLLAAFNANEATLGRITMAYSLSGPVDLWEPIRQLQSFEVVPGDPGFEEGTPGFRNIELYLGCDWDGETASTCEEAEAKAVSPLYIGDSTCPLVRITRSETEDMDEALDLVDRLEQRGCGTQEVPRAVASLAGTQHGFGQWPFIKDDVIADLDMYLKKPPAEPPPPPPGTTGRTAFGS